MQKYDPRFYLEWFIAGSVIDNFWKFYMILKFLIIVSSNFTSVSKVSKMEEGKLRVKTLKYLLTVMKCYLLPL